MGIIHQRIIERRKQRHYQTTVALTKPKTIEQVDDIVFCRCEIEIEGEFYGPFTASVYDPKLSNVVNYYKDKLPSMPEPGDEGLKVHHGLRVGCDVKDFVTWFPNIHANKKLCEAGFLFNIYTIKPDLVECGKTQLLYHPDNAVRLATMEDRSMMNFYETWVLKRGKLT